jgi:Gas vesicle protein K
VSHLPTRIDADPESVGRDLGRLVLTIVELLRQLMERQALRRVEVAMDELREHFGLRPEDLNIDLGPLGNLLPPPQR